MPKFVEKIKNGFQKTKAPSSKKNRRQGQIATIFAILLPILAHSGYVTERPDLKLALDIAAGVALKIAHDKATNTEEDLKEDEPNTESHE